MIKASLLHHGICDGNYYPCVVELDLRLGFVGVKDGERMLLKDKPIPCSQRDLAPALPFILLVVPSAAFLWLDCVLTKAGTPDPM